MVLGYLEKKKKIKKNKKNKENKKTMKEKSQEALHSKLFCCCAAAAHGDARLRLAAPAARWRFLFL